MSSLMFGNSGNYFSISSFYINKNVRTKFWNTALASICLTDEAAAARVRRHATVTEIRVIPRDLWQIVLAIEVPLE
jgi:hypothetical protein